MFDRRFSLALGEGERERERYVPDFWTKMGRDDNLSSVSFR